MQRCKQKSGNDSKDEDEKEKLTTTFLQLLSDLIKLVNLVLNSLE